MKHLAIKTMEKFGSSCETCDSLGAKASLMLDKNFEERPFPKRQRLLCARAHPAPPPAGHSFPNTWIKRRNVDLPSTGSNAKCFIVTCVVASPLA